MVLQYVTLQRSATFSGNYENYNSFADFADFSTFLKVKRKKKPEPSPDCSIV